MNRTGFFLVCLLTTVTTWAQIRVDVVQYPMLSPTGAGLFLASDINNWNAGDPRFELKRQPNGIYTLTLPDTLTRFAYKFTQGNWALTEGDSLGRPIPNRQFDRSAADHPSSIRVVIRKSGQQSVLVVQNLTGKPVTVTLTTTEMPYQKLAFQTSVGASITGRNLTIPAYSCTILN